MFFVYKGVFCWEAEVLLALDRHMRNLKEYNYIFQILSHNLTNSDNR